MNVLFKGKVYMVLYLTSCDEYKYITPIPFQVILVYFPQINILVLVLFLFFPYDIRQIKATMYRTFRPTRRFLNVATFSLNFGPCVLYAAYA